MAITAQDTKLKPGYKQTEVGVIPEDWKVKRLEELGSWKGGATPSMANASFWNNGTIYWASSGDIKTRMLSKTASMITEIAVKQSNTTLLQEGAILIVTRSGILRKYLPVAKNTVPMAINQDIKALIPNSQVSADYLLQILSECGPDILSTCIKAGTTVESVEYTWLKKYQIPLPSPPEQYAIAATLSEVDALITSLDKLIAKKRDIKQATMQQLLTGKTRLPGFSGEGEVKKLKNECELITKGTTPTSLGKNFSTHGINFIKIESLTDDGYIIWDKLAFIDKETHNLLRRSQLKNNDILFSIAGALGRTALVKHDILPANINQALALIRLKDQSCIDHLFLTKYLTGPEIIRHIGSINVQVAQANLSLEDIRNFEIRMPAIPEQQAIAAILTDMDAEIVVLEQKRDKTRSLKQGMMQELLTGKTRLV
jgi:type I restriction enzyme S subunit